MVEVKAKRMEAKLQPARLLFPKLVPGSGDSLREALRAVRELEVGGFLVMAGPAKAARLSVSRLRGASRKPLLFWLDAEWGAAQRLSGAVEFPPARCVGGAGDLKLAYQMGYWTARECLALGIRGVLAPVLDVDSNPDNPIIDVRAFDEKPDRVARMGLAFARGVRAAGGIAVAKHFPGHGDTRIDSHVGLPRLEADLRLLKRRELAPFRAAVRDGIGAVMIGHLSVPALDPSGVPASQSEPIIEGLLRRRWGFRGLVVSDALSMGGAAAAPALAAVRSLAAGCDVLLDPADAWGAAAAIDRALRDRTLDPERIAGALDRLRRSRGKSVFQPFDAPDRRAAVAVAARIAARGLRFDRPIRLRPGSAISVAEIRLQMNARPLTPFVEALRKAGLAVSHQVFGPLPDIAPSLLAELFQSARASDVFLCAVAGRIGAGLGKPKIPPGLRLRLKHALSSGPGALVLFTSPHVRGQFPKIRSVLTAYGDAPILQAAAARRLLGE